MTFKIQKTTRCATKTHQLYLFHSSTYQVFRGVLGIIFFICSYNSLQYLLTNIFMYFMQLHDIKVLKVRDSSGKMMALWTKKWQNPKELKILLNLQVSTFFFLFFLLNLHYGFSL